MSDDDLNGTRWTKGLIAGVSLTLGLAVGIVGAGLWAGGVRATIDGHIANPLIHQTPEQQEVQIRSVIDREVNPTLVRMQRQLDRIEEKLDRR
jgi:hypothetical protein